jgi:hypothetical protein
MPGTPVEQDAYRRRRRRSVVDPPRVEKLARECWFGIARHQHVRKPDPLTSRFPVVGAGNL